MDQDTRVYISRELDRVATERKIEVVLAVEVGPRAWGCAGPREARDVRFAYVQPLPGCITVEREQGTIELPLGEGRAVGWPARRLLRRMLWGRAEPFEWLLSPEVVAESPSLWPVRDLVGRAFDRKAYALEMASRARTRLRGDEGARDLLAAAHAILTAKWAVESPWLPPQRIRDLTRRWLDDSVPAGAIEALARDRSLGRRESDPRFLGEVGEWAALELRLLDRGVRGLPPRADVPVGAVDEAYRHLLVPGHRMDIVT